MRLIRSTALSLLLGACIVPAATFVAQAQIVITVGVPPPPLPVYEQPPIPASGYIWTPGYWAYDDDFGYYWVPGTWVEAPRPGLLWTPGYWGYDDGDYGYHDGYWGDEVGFYGGVDYGYGYGGDGYAGGRWQGDHFFYNSTVNNIGGVHVTNVYRETVINQGGNRVSFNGGQGGLTVHPTPHQQAFLSAPHVPPTPVQRQHVQLAQHDPALRESVNKGRPLVAATSRPNQFKGAGVVQAKSAGARPAGQQIPKGQQITKGKVTPNALRAAPSGGVNAGHPVQPGTSPKLKTTPAPHVQEHHTPAQGTAPHQPQERHVQERPVQERPVQERPVQERPVQERHVQERPAQEKAPPRAAPREQERVQSRPEPRQEPREQPRPEARAPSGGGGGAAPHGGGGEGGRREPPH